MFYPWSCFEFRSNWLNAYLFCVLKHQKMDNEISSLLYVLFFVIHFCLVRLFFNLADCEIPILLLLFGVTWPFIFSLNYIFFDSLNIVLSSKSFKIKNTEVVPARSHINIDAIIIEIKTESINLFDLTWLLSFLYNSAKFPRISVVILFQYSIECRIVYCNITN